MSYLTKILARTALGLSLAVGLGACDDGKAKREHYPPSSPPTQESVPCQRATSTTNYSLGPALENLVKSGYNSPLGLSSCLGKNSNSTLNLIPTSISQSGTEYFIERPTLTSNGTNVSFGSIKPSIYQKLTNSDPIKIFEFSDADFNDFYKAFEDITSGSERKPKFPWLDTLALSDDLILISSGFSDKIFAVRKNLETGLYEKDLTPFVQSSELIGIDELVLGSDGNIYAAQSGIRNNISSEGTIIRNPRVIKIDANTKEITPLFNMGVGLEINPIVYSSVQMSDGNYLETYNKHSLVENSEQGKLNNGVQFYASNYLEGAIFSFDGSIVTLRETDIENLPVSLGILQNGDLLKSKAPRYPNVASEIPLSNSGIDLLNDTTLTSEFHSFSDNFSDFLTDMIIFDTNQGLIPLGFDIPMSIRETPDQVEVNLTNTNTGELKQLSAQKVAP
ncbi:MAG: hypothetical protein AABX93_02125 [Nanoarchaeota archaeon]|mgnify:CR=1 FL=1